MRPTKVVFQLVIFLLTSSHLFADIDNRTVWYVLEGAEDGIGTIEKPLGTVSEINECTGPGDEIKILPSLDPLDGNIILKPGQILRGIGPTVTQMQEEDYDTVSHAQVTVMTNNATGPLDGAAIQLADNTKVINIHVRNNAGGPSQFMFNPSVSGLVQESLTLKDLLITHSGDASMTSGIQILFNGETDVSIRDTVVKTLPSNPEIPDPSLWLTEGIRLQSISTAGPVNITLKNVEVKNVGGFVEGFGAPWGGIRMIQSSDEALNIFTHLTKATNVVGDLFLISNQNPTVSGQINAEVYNHQSTNTDAARSAIINLLGAAAPLNYGQDFGFELLSRACPVNLKVRNSLMTNCIGSGLAILLNDVDANLDFGTETDLGNNAIFNNVTGAEFTQYLLDDSGLEAQISFFTMGMETLVNQGSSGAENNIGDHVDVYLDGFDSQQLCAEGNFWGAYNGSDGPAPCMELNIYDTATPGELEMEQYNSGAFNINNRWTCIMTNTFTGITPEMGTPEFMMQPKTGFALAESPYK